MEIDKLLRIREAILHFFNLQEKDSSPENYQTWLQTLPRSQKQKIEKLSFEQGRQLISFQSYLLEQKGCLINEFLASYLLEEDYEYFLLISTPPTKKEFLAC